MPVLICSGTHDGSAFVRHFGLLACLRSSFLLLVESEGFSEAEISRMAATNPAALFGIRA